MSLKSQKCQITLLRLKKTATTSDTGSDINPGEEIVAKMSNQTLFGKQKH